VLEPARVYQGDINSQNRRERAMAGRENRGQGGNPSIAAGNLNMGGNL
jgi:hypothetical protein